MESPSKQKTKHLTAKQKQAIPLLASGRTGKYVASAINCNPATISQWVNHDQEFKKALDEFSTGSLRLAQVQLESLAQAATEQLRSLLFHSKSEQVRLKAIELILCSVGLGLAKGKKPGLKGTDDFFETDSAQYDFNKLVEALGGK